MSKIKLGLPSKGRIQEDMNNFLTSAGIEIKKDGGQRTYVGSFKNFGTDAFLVPRADRHQGEFISDNDARLTWLSGFTGSAGLCIIRI